MHDRSAVLEQATNLVPLPHVVAQPLQEVKACELESWYCPDPQPGHVRSAVVEQTTNLVPLAHVAVQALQELSE